MTQKTAQNDETKICRQTLKVITPEGVSGKIYSSLDFERFFCVRYFSELQFSNFNLRKRVEQRCVKALAKEWITVRQKWLGHYYADEITRGSSLDLMIVWIDEAVGYGVWTNRAIAAGSFVGEYTGLMRKRGVLGRWQNRYCFDYTIGAGKSTSLVIDSRDGGNYTRFINHSYKPNLELVSVYCDGIIRVILYAKMAIPEGTQLLYDYGRDYWAKRGHPRELEGLSIPNPS